MTAGSGMKNIIALIPNVGSRRPPVRKRDQPMFYCLKKSVYARCEATQYTCIEREREAQIVISLFTKGNSYKRTTTFAKGYKVTLYSDSLRATALYPIYINGLNLGTQRG